MLFCDHNLMLFILDLTIEVNSVFTIFDILRIESFLESIRSSPFAADHHIVARLVPEIISKWQLISFLLPVSSITSNVSPSRQKKCTCSNNYAIKTRKYCPLLYQML